MKPREQVAAVRALHAKVTDDCVPWDCVNGNCDHDDECPPVPTDQCAECTRISLDSYEEAGVIVWPCPTIKAMEA